MRGGAISSPYPAPPASQSNDLRLDPQWSYFVYVCGFTFRFESIEQIEAAINFYMKKVHASSRVPATVGPPGFLSTHHWEVQRWYERAPIELQKEAKRQRVVAALRRARAHFSASLGS